jgi:Family of unknown function (DUF6603)
MAQKSLIQTLLGMLAELLEEARDLLTGEDTRRAIIADLGGNPSSPSAPPQFPPAGLASVKAYRDAAEPDLEALLAAVQDIRACVDALRSFVESLNLGTQEVVQEAFRSLLDLLAINFVRLRAPRLYFVLQAVSFAEEFSSTYGGQFGFFLGLPAVMRRAVDLLFNWDSWFSQSNFDDERGVQRIADRTFMAVGALLAYGIKLPEADDVMYGWDLVPGVPGSNTPTAVDRTLARMLSYEFAGVLDTPSTGGPLTEKTLTSVALVPRTQGGPGLFLSLGSGFDFDVELEKPWYVSGRMSIDSGVSLLIRKPAGVKSTTFEIGPPGAGADFRGGVAIEARPDPVSKKALDIRFAKDTGLSFGFLRFEATATKAEQIIKTTVGSGVLSVGKVFDSFLDRLIPSDGLRILVDCAVGLSSTRGAFLEGQVPSIGPAGAPATAPAPLPPPGGPIIPPPLPPLPKPESTGPGVSLRIPIGKSLGPLTINDVQLRAAVEGVDDKRAYVLEAASSLSTKLGPVSARVDRIGVRVALSVPDDTDARNLGFCDLDIGPKLPDGVGLAIDAKGVLTGGGFLYRDAALQLYAGVMQLTLHERITLTAFGLVATTLPDGSRGYSLIVFITAEGFRPIPIGMACTLQGIGGIVAINRTFSEEAMREGLKNNTLGTLLFPRDPIRNAPEIIRSLSTTFPARSGSYLFGVLAKIGWFSPTLVLLELALIFEFGARRRLIALGRISALLPSRDNDLIRLNLDAMGVIDFDEGTAAIDAVLVDSRLAHKYVLTGGMALRARWTPGPGAGFALAVGGLNPRFMPPAGFPKLDRIAIVLSSGNNPRLTCEAYFAITSNTIQFGARAQLYAAAYGFTLEGDIGYDVLVQLAPFHFLADFHASIQLKRGSRNLFKVSLAGELEGPRPLRVSGKASFEIFWCDFTVRFDKTLVSGEKPPLPPAVDVLAELRRALHAAESWSTRGAPNRQHGVTLRALPPGSRLVLDPLGNLMVKQSVVPLNTDRDIETFGGAPVAGIRRFTVTALLNDQPLSADPVKDQFVPAQFFEMTDEEKLASPSFEEMDAGLVFGSNVWTFDGAQTVAAPLVYESFVIDDVRQPSKPTADYVLSEPTLERQFRSGSAARAPIRTLGLARFRDPKAPRAATLRSVRWVVASLTDTAATVPPPSADATWTEIRAEMATLNRRAATGFAQWQVVPQYETSNH